MSMQPFPPIVYGPSTEHSEIRVDAIAEAIENSEADWSQAEEYWHDHSYVGYLDKRSVFDFADYLDRQFCGYVCNRQERLLAAVKVMEMISENENDKALERHFTRY